MPRPSRFDDVVAAAGRVFQEKGFDGARLEDIAQEVGIWKGSLYHYIDSKEDLLFAVVSEPAEHILEETRALVAKDLSAEEKLHQLARLHVEVLASAHPFTAVYIEEIAGKHRFEEWDEKDREYASLVERIVADLIGDAKEGVSPRVAARAFVGSLNWMTRWYRFDGPTESGAVADEIAEVFLRGLTSARVPKKARRRPRKAVGDGAGTTRTKSARKPKASATKARKGGAAKPKAQSAKARRPPRSGAKRGRETE